MRERARAWSCLCLTAALGVPAAALAQEEEQIPDPVNQETVTEVTEHEEVADDTGWDVYLRAGLAASLAASSKVIGSNDGNTWTVGGNLHFGWYYLTRQHEWRNDLRLAEAFARTPIIDEWVKSSDEVDFLSLYFYRLEHIPWFGPFARLRLTAPAFVGLDVRPATSTYSIARVDGTVDTVTNDRLRLTDPFQPLTLHETVGVFFSPETPEYATFEALVGFGARETFADGQLALSDNGDTPEIEILELESLKQAGAEIILDFTGQVDEGRVAYSAHAGFMTPFINDVAADDNRSAFELTNIDLAATLSIRPYDWLSVDYQVRALREPQLLDELQVTNQLLVGIAYTLIERENGEEPAE